MYNSKSNFQTPINYTPYNPNANGGKQFISRRFLKIYVGDMVQVIDNRSPLFQKFGLVEKICPRNESFQVLVKIGKISHEMFFSQLKFCTRINSHNNSHNTPLPNTLNDKDVISNYVDELDVSEEEDNIGNR